MWRALSRWVKEHLSLLAGGLCVWEGVRKEPRGGGVMLLPGMPSMRVARPCLL